MKLIFAFLFCISLVAQTVATHSVTLTWTYPAELLVPGMTFNLYRASGACPAIPVVLTTKIATGLTALTYLDSTVQDSKSYCYNVRAQWLNVQESPPSDYASVDVPAPNLPAPGGFKGTIGVVISVTVLPSAK